MEDPVTMGPMIPPVVISLLIWKFELVALQRVVATIAAWITDPGMELVNRTSNELLVLAVIVALLKPNSLRMFANFSW